MDEGNEFESIEVDDFESESIENVDSTPETAENLSLIMDEEIQGLPEEELMIPDDDSLEGDFAAQELEPEESPENVSAMEAMTEYITEHNYGKEDYETYSRDPEWQELNNRLLEEDGREPIDYSEAIPEESASEISEELPGETPETVEDPIEELVPDEIPPEETVSTWMDEMDMEARPEDIPDELPEEIPDDLPETASEKVEAPGEVLTPEEFPGEFPDTRPEEVLTEVPEEIPENPPDVLLENPPETIEAPTEELAPNELPPEETVSTWMDDVAIEATEETELMDDDVELTDDSPEEGSIEETGEAEAVAEETETVPDLENVSGWLGEVNPNFDPFDLDSPYCNNCGSCAYAVYQRLEGISNDSCASAENIGYNDEMEALTGMEQVPMSPAEIEERLLEQGDGAHAIIGIDRAEGPGHWFNAACLDGKVVAIDGQSGEIVDWPPDYGDVVNWEMSIKKGD